MPASRMRGEAGDDEAVMAVMNRMWEEIVRGVEGDDQTII